ncbi:MAG: hypothetical protein K2L82_07180 [Lachnospiraceae bacterium]|nr:hypothetical protein [Lachnospiraceae bacterium]
MLKNKEDDMRFSAWDYTRPDYAEVKKKINDCKNLMQIATSYQMFRDAWLDVKKEIEYMVFQEEIIYIRHLCGIDYQYSLEEVEIQNKEEPALYALRDECNEIAAGSPYRSELEQEFGKQIFAYVDQHRTVGNSNSMRLQSEEATLVMQYRQIMTKDRRDDEELFQVFRKLIEIRCELADSLGYDSYIELGYHLQGRWDYGIREITEFRNNIRKYVTPVVDDIKVRKIDFTYPPAIATSTGELISSIAEMFKDLSDETGNYIEEMMRKERYDLEIRENKRSNLFTCCMLPYEKLPFVIGNFTGDGMETGYAVHEFGHGFAFYTAARKQPLYELYRSSPAVNEIHSKTMEHFMYPYLNRFVGEHKKEYIRNHLMQQLENLAYRCAIDEFEHLMYDKNLSRVRLCELWADISSRYIPWNRIPLEDVHQGRCWPRQTHIVEKPFYYIQYDIAQISTYEFYLKMMGSFKQAWTDYMRLCGEGGSKSYLELLETAHLSNPFTGNTVEEICRPIVDELYDLC